MYVGIGHALSLHTIKTSLHTIKNIPTYNKKNIPTAIKISLAIIKIYPYKIITIPRKPDVHVTKRKSVLHRVWYSFFEQRRTKIDVLLESLLHRLL